jgi:hypothetical protein
MSDAAGGDGVVTGAVTPGPVIQVWVSTDPISRVTVALV